MRKLPKTDVRGVKLEPWREISFKIFVSSRLKDLKGTEQERSFRYLLMLKSNDFSVIEVNSRSRDSRCENLIFLQSSTVCGKRGKNI